jgi:hypothetical protein
VHVRSLRDLLVTRLPAPPRADDPAFAAMHRQASRAWYEGLRADPGRYAASLAASAERMREKRQNGYRAAEVERARRRRWLVRCGASGLTLGELVERSGQPAELLRTVLAGEIGDPRRRRVWLDPATCEYLLVLDRFEADVLQALAQLAR